MAPPHAGGGTDCPRRRVLKPLPRGIVTEWPRPGIPALPGSAKLSLWRDQSPFSILGNHGRSKAQLTHLGIICSSARGPDADRRAKLLIHLATEGSLLDAHSQQEQM